MSILLAVSHFACSYCRRLSSKHPKHAAGMTHMCVCAAVDSLGDDGDDANPRCCAVHCPCADSLFPCSRNKRKIKKVRSPVPNSRMHGKTGCWPLLT